MSDSTEALSAFLKRKGAHRPIAGLLLTRGESLDDKIDELEHEDLAEKKPDELAAIVMDIVRPHAALSSEIFFVWIVREDEPLPTDRFPLSLGSKAEASMVAQEHQVVDITTHGMIDMHRIGLEHARLAIHSKDQDRGFLLNWAMSATTTAQRANEERFRDMAAMRAVVLAEEDRLAAAQSRKRQDRLLEMAIRQVELVLPILASYAAKRQGAKDNEQLVGELKLIIDFAKSLSDTQNAAFIGLLDSVQLVAMGELSAGKVVPELVPVTLGRVMSGLTKEQVETITLKILDQATEVDGKVVPSRQQQLFMQLMKTQKNTMLGMVEDVLGVKLLGS
jgi:hypothetical protein